MAVSFLWCRFLKKEKKEGEKDQKQNINNFPRGGLYWDMLSSISIMYVVAIIAITLVLIPTITISYGVDFFWSADPTGAYLLILYV